MSGHHEGSSGITADKRAAGMAFSLLLQGEGGGVLEEECRQAPFISCPLILFLYRPGRALPIYETDFVHDPERLKGSRAQSLWLLSQV